jgi:hypothetical protein
MFPPAGPQPPFDDSQGVLLVFAKLKDPNGAKNQEISCLYDLRSSINCRQRRKGNIVKLEHVFS